ncbi:MULTISPECIES: ABC transporter ATP-binding protein [unclassified Diaminobutyricimonas]|uniref:ABC transporter ATP-binding protein n=1 Tax=unclassified Diaminobutyricimonas TaxID=2643261 RepID=UPI0012F4C255|nr:MULTISPECIES: ABC transporter ATP-binding protein [unclassified Diaminobutyricimonas]
MIAASTGTPPLPAGGGGVGSILELEGVTKRFGGIAAVNGVSFALPPGGRMAVIGPNGAGKSTLFRLIAGEYAPTSGRVLLFGEDATHLSERTRANRGVSRTFQVSNLFAELSVEDNVRVAVQAASGESQRFWRPVRRGVGEVGKRVDAALSQVGLRARSQRLVKELSHGEHRQLEIAMALVRQPKLLLLDEPAAGLSANERGMLRQLLADIADDVSFVLIEHDMSLALELVDRVLCLDNGSPIAYADPDGIRADPTVQAVYLGRRR